MIGRRGAKNLITLIYLKKKFKQYHIRQVIPLMFEWASLYGIIDEHMKKR